tara:strand:- start:2613 stop:4409 length:1797 start_codon:yes stop_codon:yes gene_type:complete
MKLKSSNKFSLIFLASLGFLATVFFLISSENKNPKYPKPPSYIQETTLDVIQITLNQKAFNKLEKKRFKALSNGVLETSDSDYVNAMVSFNGVDFKAEVRLKGDWTDHLKGEKWSFRVKLKGDNTIKGMRKFSIHHPQTRGYINEWLYHKAIKNEKIIGLRYDFLEGAIHVKKKNSLNYIDKKVGIYAIEETFDKRTIESNQRKESVILKYSENLWWSGVKKSLKIGSPSGLNWANFNISAYYPITVFSESKVIKDSMMASYFKTGKNLLNNAGKSISISDAFDIKKLAMHNAVLNLFGAIHNNYIINQRFYYNPITSKLEPIAFDGNSGGKLNKYVYFGKRSSKDSLYMKELVKAMYKVSNPDYLANLIQTYSKQLSNYQSILKKEFNTKLLSIENLKYNQKVIKEELKILDPQQVSLVDNVASKVINTIPLTRFENWINNEMNLIQTSLQHNNTLVFNLKRRDVLKSGYISIPNIKVNYGSRYRVNVLVKKGANGELFGLRIQGDYPNRVDAIFDLQKGIVQGSNGLKNFENVKATIEETKNGWYKCSIAVNILTKDIRVVFGVTNTSRNIESWEASINQNHDLFLIPDSLILEEF